MAELRGVIPAQILAHYDRLAVRGKKGVAVIRNQVCTGCHMKLPIGTLNVQNLGGEAYIYGFVVRQEQRGRGYGKEILARTIADILAERPQPVFLEVETENDPAFGLYRSFGFEVITTYDYYRLAA